MKLMSATPAQIQCRSGTRYTPDAQGVIEALTSDITDCMNAGYLPVARNAANLTGYVNGITAFAGGGQASAVALTALINRVTTVATAADSVKLPVAVPGTEMTVINAAGANAMNVFPASGEAINALSNDTALSVAANKALLFSCTVAGKWQSNLTA